MMRLLMLEDDRGLRKTYARRLRADGFAVDEVGTLRDARHALFDAQYDCLVLDRQVPDGDALELVADLEAEPERARVLMVSGEWTSTDDRVRGLVAGADDYLSKPVRLDELAIRVQKLTLRNGSATPAGPITLGRVVFDPAKRDVRLDGELVHLTPTQYAVFEYLVMHQDRLIPGEELMEHCWDCNRDLFSNPLHSQISRLRGVFAGALRFESVRGVGYAVRMVTNQ